MSHCCFSFDLRFLIIPLLSFGHFVVCLCTTTLLRGKKRGGKWRHFRYDVTSGYDVTSVHMTDVTSGHVTNVTSGHLTDVTSGDVTSGSTPFTNYDGLKDSQNSRNTDQTPNMRCRNTLRVMMKNPIIFWKPIIRFCFFLFWEPLYCNVFYVI